MDYAVSARDCAGSVARKFESRFNRNTQRNRLFELEVACSRSSPRATRFGATCTPLANPRSCQPKRRHGHPVLGLAHAQQTRAGRQRLLAAYRSPQASSSLRRFASRAHRPSHQTHRAAPATSERAPRHPAAALAGHSAAAVAPGRSEARPRPLARTRHQCRAHGSVYAHSGSHPPGARP
jgi:hypothetical protein